MDLKHILCLLLSAAALKVFGEDRDNEVYRWTRQSLPLMLDTHMQLLNTPLFRGQVEDEDNGGLKTLCGIECQSGLLPIDQTGQERILGYETVYENGTRTHTDIRLQGFNKSFTEISANMPTNTRWKRQVYGADGRFVISDSHFVTNYPFSAAVRLSTNCSRVLIAPKHVLTAARCIHSGRDYLESAKKLKVGVLQLKTKKIKRGRRRGGRWRGGRKDEGEAAKEKGEEQLLEEVSSDYDYALLELKRPIKQKYMKLGVAPSTAPLARIHFSGFDADKGLLDGGGDEKVVYRFCSVAKKSDDLMYQHCDAEPGATGAGVYIRLRKEVEDAGRRGKFQRRVIGVFSGHQWVEMEGGERRDFNVAVRITAPKYAQICHWIHGDPSVCRDV
ncbi:hypothetical protein Q5P01_005090 [Channa striata]|uniref:Inactive serine protease 35 n=1 Tax=Channa striata TaxID=64152 RepID=A0AA88NHX8_CHASR|nr:hypothetical protein Q5P01_005090 [Channa striata]